MDFTSKYAKNEEEKIIIRKISDLIRKSEKTYSVVYSHFLTPAEQTLLSQVDEFFGKIEFEGGYKDAERRLCRIKTDEYCSDEGMPVTLYSVKTSDKNAVFSHRDILGSLMALGIKREMIGDIITNANSAQFFCHSSVSDFVAVSLTKIGHYGIEVSQSTFSEISEPVRKPANINVSSMRLDCISAECFGLSRTKCAEYIKKGLVSVNWLICTDVSREIKPQDKISMRGKGKTEIIGISGTSKKGRLFVDILKYI